MPTDLFKLDVAQVLADIQKDVYKESPTKVVHSGAHGVCYSKIKKLDKKYNFIIHQDNDDATAYRSFLEEIIDTKKEGLETCAFDSIGDFISIWNNLGIIDDPNDKKPKKEKVEVQIGCVIMACHGEPTAIKCYYDNIEKMKKDSKKYKIPMITSKKSSNSEEEIDIDLIETYTKIGLDMIKTLEKKKMDTLLLLPCNTGHMDYKENVAATFAATQEINGLIAPDGLLVYCFNEELRPYNYYIETSIDCEKLGRKYIGYWAATKDKERERKGFINYSTGKPEPTGTHHIDSKKCLAELIKLAHMY